LSECWTETGSGVIFNVRRPIDDAFAGPVKRQGHQRTTVTTISQSLFKEDSMAEKNRKKTYLILIAILIVVLLITYL